MAHKQQQSDEAAGAARKFGRRFVAGLASALGTPLSGHDISDAELARETFKHLADLTISISERTVLRWCQGGPLPKRSKLTEILAELVSRGRIDRTRLPDIHRDAEMWRRLSGRNQGASTSPRFDDLLGLLGLSWDLAIERKHEAALRLQHQCALLPIHARIESYYGDAPLHTESSEDIVERIAQLLGEQRADCQLRIFLESPPGAGKSMVAQDLTTRLLETTWAPGVGERTSGNRLFPLQIDWNRWLAEIGKSFLTLESPDDIKDRLAKSLFQAAEVAVAPTQAQTALASRDILIVLDNVSEERDLPFDLDQRQVQQFLASINRIILIGNSLSWLGSTTSGGDEWLKNAIEYRIRLLPFDIGRMAEICRQAFLQNDPAYGNLAGLGDALQSLAVPGIARRVLAQIRQGGVSVGALSSDINLLANLYITDVLERTRSISHLRDWEAKKTSNWALVADGYGLLDTGNHEFVRTNADLLKVYCERSLDLKDPANTDSSLFDRTRNKWLSDQMPDALRFLLLILDGKFEVASDNSQTCLSNVSGLAQPKVSRTTPSDLTINISPFLRVLDVGSARCLCERIDSRKEWELPKWQRLLANAIELVEKALETISCGGHAKAHSRKGPVLWEMVQPWWGSFMASLGILSQYRSSPNGESDDTYSGQVATAIKELFDHNRDSNPGQATFRWYGAQAASLLLSGKFIISRVEGAVVDYSKEKNARSLGCELTFLGEVAANLKRWVAAHSQGRIRQAHERASVAKALVEAVNALSKEEHCEIRHARYHLWEAIARLGTRENTRSNFTLLLSETAILDDWPPRRKNFQAVECATAVGVLASLGTPLFLKNAELPSVSLQLIKLAYQELTDYDFWKSQSKDPFDNFQVTAHLFLVFKHLSPLLPWGRRLDLVNGRIVPFIDLSKQDSKPNFDIRVIERLSQETGFLGWMLDWLSQEMQAGVFVSPEYIRNVFIPIRDRLAGARCPDSLSADSIISHHDRSPDTINYERLDRMIKVVGR